MMMFHGVPLTCINQAAVHYHVPATMIVSVMKIENGRNGMAVRNTNGTYDLGVMQVNTTWLSTLAKYGITSDKLQNDPCTNVEVGTWLLAQAIADGDGWKGVANYHSHTEKFNQSYREKIKIAYFHTVNAIQGVSV